MDLQDYFSRQNSLAQQYQQDKLVGERRYYDVDEFAQIIDHFYFNQKFKFALSAVLDAEKIHPDNFEILLRKARVLIELKYFRAAIKILKLLMAEDASESELYLLTGYAYVSLNKHEKALKYFNQMVDLAHSKQEKTEFLNDIGYIFFSKQRYDLAYDFFRRSHKMAPSDTIVLYEMAFCLEKMDRDSESQHYYNIYLKENPFSKIAWYNLGVVYSKLKKYSEAIEAFDYALAIDPKFSSAIYNKANILFLQKNYKDSIESYKKVLELENNNPSAYFFIAKNYIALKKYSTALAYLKKSLEKVPMFPEAWYEIANIYYIKGNYKKGKNILLKAIRKGGSKSEYWKLLSQFYVKEKNFTKADKAFNMAVSFTPYDDSLWFDFANTVEEDRNLQYSIEILKRGSRYISDKVKLNLQLANLYFKAGEARKAAAHIEEARRLNPNLKVPENYSSLWDKATKKRDRKFRK